MGFRSSEEAFSELKKCLAWLASENIVELPAETMGEDLKALEGIVNQVQAESARRLRHFDRGRGYTASGALSAASWLHWQCRVSGAVAFQRLNLARRLEKLPGTAQAFSQGSISERHAALIAMTSEHCGTGWGEAAESSLVAKARNGDPFELRNACLRMRHRLEPEGVLREAKDLHEQRNLHLSQSLDGVFFLDGLLDPEGGATLQSALDSLMGPPSPGDGRTASQRRADAAVEMARRLLDGGQLPQRAGQKPHLLVNVDLSTLSKQPDSEAATLEWAQPIPAETARRLACDCSVTPILQGVESHQVEVGRATRVISPSMRRALHARDGGCRFPGCDMPPAWTDGHHIQHWADGGPTELWNLMLFCRRHHMKFHEDGWILVQKADGTLIAHPP